MEMALFERLAVVTLWIRESKKSLFEKITATKLDGSLISELDINLLLLVPESKRNILEAVRV
jgi:hypothetical protein